MQARAGAGPGLASLASLASCGLILCTIYNSHPGSNSPEEEKARNSIGRRQGGHRGTAAPP